MRLSTGRFGYAAHAALRYLARTIGCALVPQGEQEQLLDFSPSTRALIASARNHSMVHLAGIAAWAHAVNRISVDQIPGDIVECGVWKGGCMALAARLLLNNGDTSRRLFLYDTFEGMPKPDKCDISIDGFEPYKFREAVPSWGWHRAELAEVRALLINTGYPADKIAIVKGKVEDTIPRTIPSTIALLRLDTDFYSSTKHELEQLFPVLHARGMLFVDDYGHWRGAQRAVDEYFRHQTETVHCHRIDYTGRVFVRALSA